ncbi:MAG: ATP-binding cassette domain-containing protein [Bifidobacteriaceae bacterium]|jgi:multidrug/hemolysin transport system ATP-binding protein|nr:ATP-binding cassette domain-containing protein [Bifidobacteriaceae bacterium]
MQIIKVRNLRKQFGEIKAVDDVSFDVEKGSLFAFLGTNGAGKTTTISILTTLLRQTSGEATVNGHKIGTDDAKVRANIGVVFQNTVLDDLLTTYENLEIRGGLYGLSKKALGARINEVAEITDSTDFLKQRYGKLSGGQKRRVDVARALINRPEVLFLDEPTTGLDPKTRVQLWQTIRKMQKDFQMTVFLTTHYMEEAVDADKIVILNKGKIVATGTPNELKDRYAHDSLVVYNIHNEQAKEAVVNYLTAHNISYSETRDAMHIELGSTKDAIDILAHLKQYVDSFEVQKGDMDSVFLNAIGQKNAAGAAKGVLGND